MARPRAHPVAWPSIAAFVEAVVGRFEDRTYSVDGDGIVQGPAIDIPCGIRSNDRDKLRF